MENNINPHDIEAEQQILGAIIIQNELIRKTDISCEDFYSSKHQDIYRRMLQLNADGIPIDVVSLRSVGLEDVGYITKITGDIITTANINMHTDVVRENSRKRKLRKLCLQVISEINTETIDDLLNIIRLHTAELLQKRGSEIMSSKEMAREINEFLEIRSKHTGQLSGITSGLKDLDELTDGFQQGEMTIIAGRPGTGKSAFAMACASHAGVPVGVISLEMGSHQLGIRQLSTLSGVDLWRLRKGFLRQEDWPNVAEGFKAMAELPVYFSFSSYKTTAIERTITQMIEIYGCQVVIVDYLQLTKGNESKKREQEVAEVSRTLKLSALQHNMPILVLSQLNREVEKRQQEKPVLSDLRESGAIEQDADVVIFLWKDTKSKKPDDKNTLYLSIAKGRNCGLGEIKLYVDFDTMTFGGYKNDER